MERVTTPLDDGGSCHSYWSDRLISALSPRPQGPTRRRKPPFTALPSAIAPPHASAHAAAVLPRLPRLVAPPRRPLARSSLRLELGGGAQRRLKRRSWAAEATTPAGGRCSNTPRGLGDDCALICGSPRRRGAVLSDELSLRC